jgi:hypothetical protein
MDLTKIKQTMHVIFNNEKYREHAMLEAIISPVGLEDKEFISLAQEFGAAYDIIEFEMFWNTGKIPAFCFLRLVADEEA